MGSTSDESNVCSISGKLLMSQIKTSAQKHLTYASTFPLPSQSAPESPLQDTSRFQWHLNPSYHTSVEYIHDPKNFVLDWTLKKVLFSLSLSNPSTKFSVFAYSSRQSLPSASRVVDIHSILCITWLDQLHIFFPLRARVSSSFVYSLMNHVPYSWRLTFCFWSKFSWTVLCSMPNISSISQHWQCHRLIFLFTDTHPMPVLHANFCCHLGSNCRSFFSVLSVLRCADELIPTRPIFNTSRV